jgi:hypothetical protein
MSDFGVGADNGVKLGELLDTLDEDLVLGEFVA